MARFLVAWELGEGYGHLGRHLGVALELRERGHEVIFALKDLAFAERALGRHGFTLLQAPVWLHTPRNLPHAASYAEILFRVGFLDAEALTAKVRAWQSLYDLVQPDVVVFDHAPTALLAARRRAGDPGFPRVTSGQGFFVPPRTSPLPGLLPDASYPVQRLMASEQRVLEVVNAVNATLGQPPMDMLAELFDVEQDFMCTFAELDTYAEHREGARYLGPDSEEGHGEAPRWPARGEARVFAYIRPRYHAFEALLGALADSGHAVLVHAPGIARELIERHASRRMAIMAKPARMSAVLRKAKAVVCHAGHGTVSAALLAGVPLLVMPTQVEQHGLGQRLAALGAGIVLDPRERTPDHARALARLLGEPRFRAAARAFAGAHADFDPVERRHAMVANLEALAG